MSAHDHSAGGAGAPARPIPAPWRWVGGAAIAAALLATFSLYGAPDLMLQVAQQLWACVR